MADRVQLHVAPDVLQVTSVSISLTICPPEEINLSHSLSVSKHTPRIIFDSNSEHLWPTLPSEQRLPRLTVSVVDVDTTLWNMLLQPEGCLLSMESLREDSLWDTEMHSLLLARDRKCRQGTFSASVSLLKITNFLQFMHLKSAGRWSAAPTYIWNEWLRRWKGCRWRTPWRWQRGPFWNKDPGCFRIWKRAETHIFIISCCFLLDSHQIHQLCPGTSKLCCVYIYPAQAMSVTHA